jgi:hypothetical protein
MLTHCTQQQLPNLAHLISVILPDSMDGDNGGASNNNADDVRASHKLGGGEEGGGMTMRGSLFNSNGRHGSCPCWCSSTPVLNPSDSATADAIVNGSGAMATRRQPAVPHPSAGTMTITPTVGERTTTITIKRRRTRKVKYFLCHLLVALDALYATSIMHTDVKPQNMLINCLHLLLGGGGSNPEDVHRGEGVIQTKDGGD